MSQSKSQTARKIDGRIARHKAVRYHNDSKLFHTESKICPVCNRSFENRKKWQSRGLWPEIKYCSKKCQKIGE